MINRLQLLRNVGLFDSADDGANLPLRRLTLVYAENGRGKTTLAAILRSLATGDPIPIAERRRLGALHPPHVVLDCSGGPPAAIFENNAWNRTIPNMVVFDDAFVDQNVSSGLVVETEHRQNLHELILGAQAVTLNQRLEEHVARVEEHNVDLRTKGEAIPASERGTLTIDEFCALPARPDIDAAIQTAGRTLAAAREQVSIRDAPFMDALALPSFDVAATDQILQRDLSSLDATAVAQVEAHLAGLGHGAEAWVADGMQRVSQPPPGSGTATCPFCAQSLESSPVINHYRAYFSAAYADLKSTVADALAELNRAHGGDAQAAFERAIRVAGERQRFWSQFCDVPGVALDTAVIARDWRAAREAVAAELDAKQAAPLEHITMASSTRTAVERYGGHRQAVDGLSQRLQQANEAINVVQEQAATGNATALAADIAHLRDVKARHAPMTADLCDDYLRERAAKAETEQRRDEARAELNQYRTTIFTAYQTAMNMHLHQFNAGFRLDSMKPVNTRTGSSCTYDVLINDTPVPVSGGTPTPGEPSFRNTLSSGDRSTLALAFFFASLDKDPALASKIVVIDDPIASLDEHRALTTAQEIRRLAHRASQVIVLSHDKPFLCRIWQGADTTTRAALLVARDGAGSTLREWDVNEDAITEHDRRHALLREYLERSTPNNRPVAESIRPVLEAFVRVAYPDHFGPGAKLGPFRHLCEQRVGTPGQILDERHMQELDDLVEYANKFHHDTNPAWETEVVNDTELRGFVMRALDFIKP